MTNTAHPQPDPTACHHLHNLMQSWMTRRIGNVLIDDTDYAEFWRSVYDVTGESAAYDLWCDLKGPDDEPLALVSRWEV